ENRHKPRIGATLTNQGPCNGRELYPIFTVTVDGGHHRVQPFFGGTAAQCACPRATPAVKNGLAAFFRFQGLERHFL
ncbi:MAG TPA: hypothetical protein VNB54_01825, partial [Alphaproteobacteria bacterium]|nr:hypothetical protein [Alphaproteobacteria bacterium]